MQQDKRTRCEARDELDAVAVCVSKPEHETLCKDNYDFYTETIRTDMQRNT